uniref:4-coumarate--CoA ligase n=1 Tax=Chenopodium quinoa TaxID=63459 RepID=A0A803N5C0_CHEQI
MYELHFAVPMAGAVLCSLNIRHDSAMVSVLLKHSKAKLIFVDYQFLDTTCLSVDCPYVSLQWLVLYMGIAAQGGINIFLRNVVAKDIFSSIAEYKVTHMGGAPTVLNMIINSPDGDKKPLPGKVVAITGGAPPAPQVLFKMEEIGLAVTHGYELTEAYGPATVCVWKPEWDALPPNERQKIKARQVVLHLGLEEVDVKDPITMKSVPTDAKTIGEVILRGNTIMTGYLSDEKATQEAFENGWYHSGDLAVKYPDVYIQIKDRAKDIIISGGENISSIEVEDVISSHPVVLEVAVVARPDDHWGETPCAFVKLKDGCNDVTSADIIKFCRDRLPHYMAPRTVVFEDLQRTITGKAQKYILREKAKALGSLTKTSKL